MDRCWGLVHKSTMNRKLTPSGLLITVVYQRSDGAEDVRPGSVTDGERQTVALHGSSPETVKLVLQWPAFDADECYGERGKRGCLPRYRAGVVVAGDKSAAAMVRRRCPVTLRVLVRQSFFTTSVPTEAVRSGESWHGVAHGRVRLETAARQRGRMAGLQRCREGPSGIDLAAASTLGQGSPFISWWGPSWRGEHAEDGRIAVGGG